MLSDDVLVFNNIISGYNRGLYITSETCLTSDTRCQNFNNISQNYQNLVILNNSFIENALNFGAVSKLSFSEERPSYIANNFFSTSLKNLSGVCDSHCLIQSNARGLIMRSNFFLFQQTPKISFEIKKSSDKWLAEASINGKKHAVGINQFAFSDTIFKQDSSSAFDLDKIAASGLSRNDMTIRWTIDDFLLNPRLKNEAAGYWNLPSSAWQNLETGTQIEDIQDIRSKTYTSKGSMLIKNPILGAQD